MNGDLGSACRSLLVVEQLAGEPVHQLRKLGVLGGCPAVEQLGEALPVHGHELIDRRLAGRGENRARLVGGNSFAGRDRGEPVFG